MLPENQLKLQSGKIITFNDEQIEGLKKINNWLKSTNGSNMFCLSGFGGTGKSCTIKKVLDNYRHGVCVSAPTHKAQGSTYENVLINESDINLNPDIIERNKLRYVALSRPSKLAIILSDKIDE